VGCVNSSAVRKCPFAARSYLRTPHAWGSALEEAWKAETGEAKAPDPGDADPLYRRFVDFKAEKIEETFVYWRDQVKASHLDVALSPSLGKRVFLEFPALAPEPHVRQAVG
jgi:hypothetical protein